MCWGWSGLCNGFKRQGDGVGGVEGIVAAIVNIAEAGDALDLCTGGGIVIMPHGDDAGDAVHRLGIQPGMVDRDRLAVLLAAGAGYLGWRRNQTR